MTWRELAAEGSTLLQEAGIDSPAFDAKELLLFVSGMEKRDYLLRSGEEADAGKEEDYRCLIRRRVLREPLQYIIGEAPFYGRSFIVRPGVLIPRFDTETLVEAVLPYTAPGKRILDLCTGSGCILLTLLLEGAEGMQGTGTDLSSDALGTARLNAAKFSLNPELYQGDLFAAADGKYDIITSNPPYIPTDVIQTLDPEVRDFEPHTALDGDADGLLFYRRIVDAAPKHLTEHGLLAMEIGYDQGESVPALMEESFTDVRVIRDLSGLPRAVLGLKKN
ncbi:MAG: peptide chain release factor N(5)-glutamine methyltransferase [Lachnospiraceae bacterium]|nr:peptide chain release factor N(5)-glutamine methyltransferase [Lachnospiraceae bacterium]